MTFGDLEPEKSEIISVHGFRIYMTPFRAVICPSGEILLMDKQDLKQAYKDLGSWGLPINSTIMDQ